MKRFTLLTLCVGFPFFADASAQAADYDAQVAEQLRGLMTIQGGVMDYETTDGDDSNDGVLAGNASVVLPFGEFWSAQIDILGENVLTDGDDNDQYESMAAVGGHLSWHVNDTGLIGILAGYGFGSPTDEETWRGGIIGLEGQAYLGQFTLYGQAALLGIGEDDEDEGFDDSAYLLRAVARYFIHDDFKLEGEVAYIRGDNVIDDDDDGKGWEWGVMAQMRLFDLPVYGSLAYRAGDWDATTEGDEAETQSVMVGLTFLFGSQSLMENDRAGAGLDTPTTPFRASGVFSELD